MHRTSIDPPVCLSRFEESLQTPGGTAQRDLDLAAPWGLQTADRAQWTRKTALCGHGPALAGAAHKERLETAGAAPEALSFGKGNV